MMIKSNLSSLFSSSASPFGSLAVSTDSSASSSNLVSLSANATTNNSTGSYSLVEKCTYCQTNLSNVSIKCAECINFYLCLKCFSMSAEIGDHKKDHNYYLKCSSNFPLFDSEKFWTYKEELLLLQFIEQYGLGNWDDIAKHLPNRTATECMSHYHSYYIHGNIGKYTFGAGSKNNNSLKNLDQSCDTFSSLSLHSNTPTKKQLSANGINGVSNNNHNSRVKAHCVNTSPNNLNSTKVANELATTVLLPPIEMSLEEQRALGYMPLRDDFEREYKNDAETLLSNLNIAIGQVAFIGRSLEELRSSSNLSSMIASSSTNDIPAKSSKDSNLVQNGAEPNDDLIDYDIKLTLIKMYRECLIERQRFKKIAREYGLINNASALINNYNNTVLNLNPNPTPGKKGRKPANKNGKEMNELNEKLKKYAQFMSVSDYEILLENLRKQRQLSEKIRELQYYRNLGLKKLEDIDKYNQEKLDMANKKLELKMEKSKRIRKRFSTRNKRSLGGEMKNDVANSTINPIIPTKRFTRYSLLQSPSNKSFEFQNSPSKRMKCEPNDHKSTSSRCSSGSNRSRTNSSTNDTKLTDSENDDEQQANEEIMTDDLNESDEDDVENEEDQDEDDLNVDDDEEDDEGEYDSENDNLYQERSDADEYELNGDLNDSEDEQTDDDDENDDDDEDDNDDDDDEDMSSTDYDASDTMVRRLRKLDSRTVKSPNVSTKNSKHIKPNNKKNHSNNNSKLETSNLKQSNTSMNNTNNKKISSKNLKHNENVLTNNNNNGNLSSNGSGGGAGSKVNSKKLVKNKNKKKENILNSRNGRTERLCSMPGYNLLSENEKKLISSIHMKPNDYINFKTILIKNSIAHRKTNQSVNTHHNQTNVSLAVNTSSHSSTSFSSASTSHSPNTNNSSTNAYINSSTKLMTLRRQSISTPNGQLDDLNGHSVINGASLNNNHVNNLNTSTCSSTSNNSCNYNNGAHNHSSASFLNHFNISMNDSMSAHHASAAGMATSNVNSTANGFNRNKLIMELLKSSCPSYFEIPRSTRKRILRFLCDNGWIDVS